MLSKVASSTIFWVFGMTWPGIEPRSPRPLANTLLIKPMICHHHVVPLARISLTLSRHFSLSFIASGRSSGLHPVSSHSCYMYVRAGRPAFPRPYAGVHRSTSLMSSSLLLQQCPTCLVRLTWIVFVMEAGGRIVGALWGVAARTCSIYNPTILPLFNLE